MSDIKRMHSAGGVLFNKNRVLLIHWDPPRDSYNFPKGGIDGGESAAEACVREIQEETGYQVKVIAPIGQNEFSLTTHDGRPAHKIVDYFLLEMTSEEPLAPNRGLYETFENIWVPIEQARHILTNDIDIPILEKALELRPTEP